MRAPEWSWAVSAAPSSEALRSIGRVVVEVARLAQGDGWTVNLFVLDTSVHETKLTEAQIEEAAFIVLPAVMSVVGLPFGDMGKQGMSLKRGIEARALATVRFIRM